MRHDSLISAADATVPVTVQARAQVAPDKAFEVIVPIDLSLIFSGWDRFQRSADRTTRPEHGITLERLGIPTSLTAARPPRLSRSTRPLIASPTNSPISPMSW